MNRYFFLLNFVMMMAWSTVSGEVLCRYRVYLTDKKCTTYSLNRPEEFLSSRAIERRMRQHLAVDSTDLPVCRTYIEEIRRSGGKVLNHSKWNNTVVVELSRHEVLDSIRALPFVKKVKRVWIAPDEVIPRNKERKKMVTNKVAKTDDYYGHAAAQIRMHHGDSLHAAGFRGEGMQIAVIDAGYYNVDAIKLFRNMDLLGVRDFVNPDSDIYEEHSHGLKVLSCLAVDKPYFMVGTAPKASYWLLRSEDNDTEQPIEEDNWAAAIEFADSVGVDVVNTSLGYYEFDDKEENYRYRDLDGKTSFMSVTAEKAAGKGLLVVCSAGNAGGGKWKKISPPADAEDVITVGALDYDRTNADFSSIGNTADGRVKPDIMALGVRAVVVGENGGISRASGTSFAAPIFCGLVTCLWQAFPDLTVKEIIDVVRRSGSRYTHPDNIYGYGVADIWKAYQLIQKERGNR